MSILLLVRIRNPMVAHLLQPGVKSNKAGNAGHVVHKDNGTDVPVVVVGDFFGLFLPVYFGSFLDLFIGPVLAFFFWPCFGLFLLACFY